MIPIYAIYCYLSALPAYALDIGDVRPHRLLPNRARDNLMVGGFPKVRLRDLRSSLVASRWQPEQSENFSLLCDLSKVCPNPMDLDWRK